MKAAILFLFIFFISFSAQAQVGATITPCTEGAQNGAIDLTFPADYPHTLLSYNWYQIIGDVEVSITDTDLSDLDIIEGLLPGNYRVSLSRAGWCGGVVRGCVRLFLPSMETPRRTPFFSNLPNRAILSSLVLALVTPFK